MECSKSVEIKLVAGGAENVLDFQDEFKNQRNRTPQDGLGACYRSVNLRNNLLNVSKVSFIQFHSVSCRSAYERKICHLFVRFLISFSLESPNAGALLAIYCNARCQYRETYSKALQPSNSPFPISASLKRKVTDGPVLFTKITKIYKNNSNNFLSYCFHKRISLHMTHSHSLSRKQPSIHHFFSLLS
jgi:hypothetical protein